MSSTNSARLTGRSDRARFRAPRRWVSAVAAVAVAALGALATPAAAETPDPTKVSFVVGIKQDIDSLNPYVGVVSAAFEAYQVMYDSLTGSSAADFSPEPGLAESWETSPDGRTWTYHLRKGVKWSDGTDLTAKDVVYTFKRAQDDEVANGQYGSYVDGITEISSPDDHTVVLTTEVPSPIMLRLAVPILPEHIWSKISADEVGNFANDTGQVGSGPFQLVESEKGQFYRFSANKNYWGGAPKIDELVFRIFAEDEALAQALKNGEIDMAQDLAPAQFEALVGHPGIATNDAKYYGFSELGLNTGAATDEGKPIGDGHPALKDLQVRLAIDHAIDRKTLVEKVLRNHGEPATGVIPPIYADLHWNPGSAERSFDLAKANGILDAAGYAMGSNGIRAKDGKELKFRYFARDSSEASKNDGQYIREWLKEIGIEVVVSVMSEDNLTDVLGKGEFDLFHWGWVVEPDPDFQLSVMTCGQRSYEEDGEISAGWSDSFYCNEAYDALYAKQQTLVDPAQRAAVVKQAQEMLYNDVAYSMLYYYNQFEAYRSDKFTGFVAQPSDGGIFAFQYGTHSYRSIEPVKDEARAGDSTTSVLLVLGIAGAVVLLIAVIVVVIVLRRRAGADDRE